MKQKIMTVALAGAYALITMPAMAEEAYQGPWYLLPNIGVMHPDSDLKADDKNLSYGLRIGKEITENWDIQMGLTQSRADEDSHRYSGDQYRQTMLGVDALYFFSRDKFRPFLLAGLGVAHNSIHYNGIAPTANADGSNNSWMGNFGVGAQYLFTDNIGMQAAIRQVYSRAKADGGLFGSDRHETVGNTYLNIGVVFRFGVPKQVSDAGPTQAKSPPEAGPEPYQAPTQAKQEQPKPTPMPEPTGPDEAAFAKMTIQSEVLFAFDKSNLKPEGEATLNEQVVEKMKANSQVELLLITGHTDRIGSDRYNQKLSERRAESVKTYLVSQGIEASRLHTVGKGETMPVADCAGPRSKQLIQCLQPNRRVVLEIEAQRASPK
jgi:OOP family OmpA-OmpF porin